MDDPTTISPQEFERSIEAALEPPSDGVTIFHAGNLLAQPDKFAVVGRRFEAQRQA